MKQDLDSLFIVGLGFMSAIARVGSILAPFIVMAGETSPGQIKKLVPLIFQINDSVPLHFFNFRTLSFYIVVQGPSSFNFKV